MNELDPLSRSLLAAAARGHEPAEVDHARVRGRLMRRLGLAAGCTALGAAITQTSSAMAATAGTTGAEGALTGTLVGSAKLWAIGKLLSITVAVTAAGFGGYEWASSSQAPEQAHAAASRSAGRTLPMNELAKGFWSPAVDSEKSPEPVPDELLEDNPAATAAASALHRAEATGASAATVPQRLAGQRVGADSHSSVLPSVASFPAEPPRLAAEARALAGAQAALREGDATRALQLLDAQSAQFYEGSLDEERAAARVVALCRSGQVQAANSAAAEFLKRSPHSVLAERVANACSNQK